MLPPPRKNDNRKEERMSAKSDKMFITEILNDLHRHGYVERGKADTMLSDWAIELRRKAAMAPSRLRKTFNEEVGACNW